MNLQKIIDERGLDKKEVAKLLFPDIKYPILAFNRVLADVAVLDSTQVSKLALFADLTIDEIYSGRAWKATSKKGRHKFISGDFIAELDLETGITKVFHKGSLFHESVLHSTLIPLSSYIEELNNLIQKKNA